MLKTPDGQSLGERGSDDAVSDDAVPAVRCLGGMSAPHPDLLWNVVVAGYSFKVARGMSAGGAYTHSCRGRSAADSPKEVGDVCA